MSKKNILQRISQQKATLKIITKTKNERLFIEKWIQHHLAIIGDGKLIIFDNMSDDEHVLNIYEKYKENILLIKFDFNHNDIHRYHMITPFYQAIHESTDFFTILDSDEFLYLYDEKENKVIHDTSILEFLKENNDCDFFTPCWLTNKHKSANTLEQGFDDLTSHFGMAKPIINTKIFNNPQIKNYGDVVFRHTFELPPLQYAKTKTSFLIAHLCNLDIDQRIATNMNKLVSNKILKDSSSFEELFCLSKDVTENATLQGLIIVTQELVSMKKTHGDYPIDKFQAEYTITLEKDASVTFSNPLFKGAFLGAMKRSFLDFIEYDDTVINSKDYPTIGSWVNSKKRGR